jgi:flagellar basal-body rod protein FlgB
MTVSILQTATARLGYLSDVQNVLAGNLANIDTPGFQANNVVPFADFMNGATGNLAMLQTSSSDLLGQSTSPDAASPASLDAQHSPDGNAVSLDQQLVQISKNETDQQFTANLYQAYMGMFKTALGSTG